MIKVRNGSREKGVDIYQHWLTVGESLARCNLVQLEGKQLEKELHVAAYLNAVRDSLRIDEITLGEERQPR